MSKHRDAHQLQRANRDIETVRQSLRTIVAFYDAVLSAPVAADDSDVRNSGFGAGEPVRVDLIDARTDAYRDLRAWVGFILSEVHGGTITTKVGSGVTELAEFILRWTPTVIDEHPEDAENLVREMSDTARRLESLARGWTTKRIEVGRCPEQIITIGNDGIETHQPCTGNLWAILRSQDTLLPESVTCDTSHDHAWSPWQWAALGRRIGT